MTYRPVCVFYLVLSLAAIAAQAGMPLHAGEQRDGLAQSRVQGNEDAMAQRKAALRASLQAQRQETGNIKQRQLSPQDRADLRQQIRQQLGDGGHQ